MTVLRSLLCGDLSPSAERYARRIVPIAVLLEMVERQPSVQKRPEKCPSVRPSSRSMTSPAASVNSARCSSYQAANPL